MRNAIRGVLLVAALAACSDAWLLAQDLPELVSLPRSATALEGRPAVSVTSEESETERKVLTPAEARKNRLLITIVDGRYFWASRGNVPLELTVSGGFTYLAGKPGSYVKFTRVGERIMYMEHATLLLSSITYWGELEVVSGR